MRSTVPRYTLSHVTSSEDFTYVRDFPDMTAYRLRRNTALTYVRKVLRIQAAAPSDKGVLGSNKFA